MQDISRRISHDCSCKCSECKPRLPRRSDLTRTTYEDPLLGFWWKTRHSFYQAGRMVRRWKRTHKCASLDISGTTSLSKTPHLCLAHSSISMQSRYNQPRRFDQPPVWTFSLASSSCLWKSECPSSWSNLGTYHHYILGTAFDIPGWYIDCSRRHGRVIPAAFRGWIPCGSMVRRYATETSSLASIVDGRLLPLSDIHCTQLVLGIAEYFYIFRYILQSPCV